MPAAILHEDRDVLVVDKPAGVTVIPARDGEVGASLRSRLEAARGERLWVVHRLDRETSGVVVFARHAEAHRALSEAFEQRRVEKRYVAFVTGAVEAARTLDVALHAARKGKMRPAKPGEPGAKPAVTEVSPRRAWRREGRVVTEVEARPRSGRQHQIRVHLRWAGAPILFDPLYTPKEAMRGLEGAPGGRLALHAHTLVVPGVGRFEAPLPEDLRALGAWLDGWAA